MVQIKSMLHRKRSKTSTQRGDFSLMHHAFLHEKYWQCFSSKRHMELRVKYRESVRETRKRTSLIIQVSYEERIRQCKSVDDDDDDLFSRLLESRKMRGLL